MVDEKPVNESEYVDDQNFDININGIYSSFIQAIDSIRSNYLTYKIDNSSAKKIFSEAETVKDARNNLIKISSLQKTAQESRCHAFYRLIGFPIVGADKKFFNPGFDIVFYKNKIIDEKYKLGVAKNQIENFRDLSIEREKYVDDVKNIFNTTSNISLPTESTSVASNLSLDASTLALSSGRNIRKFNSSFSNIDPFDMNVKNQQYTVNFESVVGISNVDLIDYQDASGTKPIQLFSFDERTHIIKPFIVDPVIDFTVNHSTKLVGIPFVPNSTYLQVDKTTRGKINQPLLEQIIRKRQDLSDKSTIATGLNKTAINYVDSLISQDTNLLKKKKDLFNKTPQNQLNKFTNIIVSMIEKLVKAQDTIKEAQQEYYWLPIPSSSGPEGGCSVRPLLLPDKINPVLITVKDREAFDAKYKETFYTANISAETKTDQADVGGYRLDALKIFDLDGAKVLGNLAKQNFDKLSQMRNETLTEANEALKIVEIIMGEFSGLGFCDIIAILGGLYLMPLENLYGFLDNEAILRMNAILKIKITPPPLETTMSNYIEIVQYLYNLMDKIYLDISENNGYKK